LRSAGAAGRYTLNIYKLPVAHAPRSFFLGSALPVGHDVIGCLVWTPNDIMTNGLLRVIALCDTSSAPRRLRVYVLLLALVRVRRPRGDLSGVISDAFHDPVDGRLQLGILAAEHVAGHVLDLYIRIDSVPLDQPVSV